MENDVVDMEKDPFKEYLRESEPDKAHKGYAWSTAIGLQTMSVPKKRIRFLYVLQKSFQKLRSHFRQMSISLSTANSFRGFTTMLERLEIITSQRENGSLMGQPLCTVALLN